MGIRNDALVFSDTDEDTLIVDMAENGLWLEATCIEENGLTANTIIELTPEDALALAAYIREHFDALSREGGGTP